MRDSESQTLGGENRTRTAAQELKAKTKAGISCSSMRVGAIFRYPSSPIPTRGEVDGFPNFYFATGTPGAKAIKLDRGIWQIANVIGPDGPRRPAIIVSSTPHKVGAASTPWLDV